MFNWEDRKYVNPRKRVFKNVDTDEILNLEIQDDPDNIEKESNTPLNAHNLNQSQQDMLDDMSKTYTGTSITANTVEGYGRINKVYGHTIEEGSGEKSPTNPYTLRCVGDDVNLFDGKIELGAIFTDTGILTPNNDRQRSINFIEIKGDTQYLITVNNEVIPLNIIFYDKNYNFISSIPSGNFTTPAQAKYMKFYSSNLTNAKIKLQEGSIATPYSSYGYGTVEIISQNGDNQSSNIVVTKPLCCLKDTEGKVIAQDYIDYSRGVVHRECGYLVFDGSDDEGWYLDKEDYVTSRKSFWLMYNNGGTYNCSHFNIVNIDDIESVEEYFASSEIAFQIGIKKERLDSIDAVGFKTWLSKNPVTITYKLATPLEEQIDCSNKIVQYADETTVHNRDNAEIEVSLTNNKAMSEVNEEFKNNEIQTITNENGTAIKYPNGIIICYAYKTFHTGATYGEFIWNFPNEFISNDYAITASMSIVGNSASYTLGQNNRNQKLCEFIVFKNGANIHKDADINVNLMAIGRWI